MFLRSAIDQVVLQTRVAPRLAALVRSRPHPEGAGHDLVDGPAPVHLLVTGGGLAVGYGVSTWQQGLGMATASALGAASGRGVVVDQVPLPTLDADQIELLLLRLRDPRYHLVVWSPAYNTERGPVDTERWRSAARAVRAAWRKQETAPHGVVTIGIPPIAGTDHDGRIAAAAIAKVNEELAAVAARVTGTAFVVPPPIEPPEADRPQLGPAYYERCAAQLTPVLLDLLRPAGRPD